MCIRDRYSIAVITNDIYTKEDAQFLARNSVLPEERIIGVETGGCPHTAIREDASMNIEAVDEMLELSLIHIWTSMPPAFQTASAARSSRTIAEMISRMEIGFLSFIVLLLKYWDSIP